MPVVLNQTKSDYPFGMVMPGRNWTAASAEGYRFGFNGKEGDGEIKGEDNSLDFGANIYDPRIGKWFKVDDLSAIYPENSPFSFAANNPIMYIDRDGNKLTAANVESMMTLMEHFSTVFSDYDVMNKLFQVTEDGLSIKPISLETLYAAIRAVDAGNGDYFDERDATALAYGYYSVVNSEDVYEVEFVENDTKLDEETVFAYADLANASGDKIENGKNLPNGGAIVSNTLKTRILLNTDKIESIDVYNLTGSEVIKRNPDAGIANAIVGTYLVSEYLKDATESEKGLKSAKTGDMKMIQMKVENLGNRIVNHPQSDGSMYGIEQLYHKSEPSISGNCCDVTAIPDRIQVEVHDTSGQRDF